MPFLSALREKSCEGVRQRGEMRQVMEIRGKISTAICYAKVVEDEAVEQIRRMCDYDFTEGSRIRIMPDVHAGAGCTIGTTMTVTDRVVPNIVGVDIGCGMYTIALGKELPALERLDEAAHYVPSGKEVWEGRQEKFDLQRLRCYRSLKDSRRLERSLGTLGGGNHFIEVDRDEDGNLYLVIHSGSRHLGLEVANYYQEAGYRVLKEAATRDAEDMRDYAQEVFTGSRSGAELNYAGRTRIPRQLAYVSGSLLEQYLHDMKIVQYFAELNRQAMVDEIVKGMKLHIVDQFATVHNYIDTDAMILRKGAVSAAKGEKLLIPMNMRDGSLICTGKGNDDWNQSAPHGAGRLMSRSAAKESFTVSEYKNQMAGIYTTSVNRGTLDECPMAYKGMEEIVNRIGDTVEIVQRIKPVYNFKAGGEEKR